MQELNASFLYASEALIKTFYPLNKAIKKTESDQSLFDKFYIEYNHLIEVLTQIKICKIEENDEYKIDIKEKYKNLSIKQIVILMYILKHKPYWSYKFKQGIDQLREIKKIDINLYQCLYETGIFNDILSGNASQFIKLVRDEIYLDTKKNKNKSNIGLFGEMLTMNYESAITNKEPKHIAIYDNYAGYDVLSCSDNKAKRVEVKASKHNIGFITWNEWKKANESINNNIAYEFHLWDLSEKGIYKLAILEVADLNFIPNITECAHHFETYFINFEAFRSKFQQFKVKQIGEELIK
tara:strand:- start:985 stop:1872 length:888 start_codon:yes stop_codon:yes gene_type:complete